MLLGKVVARVVSTAKLEAFPARALLQIEPLPGFESGALKPFIAIDGVGAGTGETVLVMQEGTGAREVLGLDSKHPLPAQMVVVGIVDAIQV